MIPVILPGISLLSSISFVCQLFLVSEYLDEGWTSMCESSCQKTLFWGLRLFYAPESSVLSTFFHLLGALFLYIFFSNCHSYIPVFIVLSRDNFFSHFASDSFEDYNTYIFEFMLLSFLSYSLFLSYSSLIFCVSHSRAWYSD